MSSRHFPSSLSLLRRDRSKRRGFDPRRDKHSHGREICFEDLAIDPRMASVFHTRSIDARNFDPRIIREEQSVRELPPKSGLLDEYGDPRLRSRIVGRGRGPNSLPFGRAMNKLFRQLEQAEKFYGDFQLEYDSDISEIKKYATVEVLSALWILKVKGGRDRRDSLGSQHTMGDEISSERATERFEAMQRKTIQSLEGALTSTLNEGPRLSRRQMTRIESAKRLQRKVDIANEQILDLLESATRGREYCEGLLSELELLKALIDPINEKNRELYKGGRDDGGLSSIEDDHDEQQQQPAAQQDDHDYTRY